MQYQSKKDFEKFKKKNSFSLCYIIEKKVNIAKIELLLENVLAAAVLLPSSVD